MSLIITAGSKIDIDALACAIAYKNILEILGIKSSVLLSEVWWTVPEEILSWWHIVDNKKVKKDDTYIVVDISEPNYIDPRINQENIIELRDHHPWYETYREEKIWTHAKIEHIGACATLIFEKAEKEKITEKLADYSINLLLTAILANTLNFKAQITNERDITAYTKLRKISNLPWNWSEIYFKKVEENIIQSPKESLINDTKVIPLLGKKITIVQIELRESEKFMIQNKELIEKVATSYGEKDWLYTSPSIGTWTNNLFTTSTLVKNALIDKIWATFSGDFGTTKTLRLRKEIWKKLL